MRKHYKPPSLTELNELLVAYGLPKSNGQGSYHNALFAIVKKQHETLLGTLNLINKTVDAHDLEAPRCQD